MPGAFESHLTDAIAVNRERASVYARLSRGRSRLVSGPLIGSELALLPVARWFDRRAEPYHAAGVPVLDSMFVSMTAIRAAEMVAPGGERSPGSRRVASRRIRQAFSGNDGIVDAIDAELARLASSRGDAMRRHLLESARRVATLTPILERLALDAGLPSPMALLRRLLALHLRGLTLANALDDLAWPVQRLGVPILIHDLPTIPEWDPSLPRDSHAERARIPTHP